MRFIDFLSEASIFTRPEMYDFGHVVRFGGNKDVAAVIDKIQQAFPDFDPQEKLTWVAEAPDDVIRINLGKRPGANERYFQRENGDIFAITGADTSIEALLNHADKFNRGDIAEGILGSAITAKIIKRGSDRIGAITVADIKHVLSSATAQDDALVFTVEDKNSVIADNIEFVLRLPQGSMIAISDERTWPQFENLFAAALHYANGSDAERYSNYFYQNGKVDQVTITSDGVSNNKATKTDIDVKVKDPQGNPRTLKNVDLSLKADSPIYGQFAAGGVKKSADVWFIKSKELFEPLGITLTKPPKTNDINAFHISVYKQVASKLHKELKNASVNKETAFIEKIADLIEGQGSLGNKSLRLVNLSKKGESSIHSFSLLKRNLLDRKIDLGVKHDVSAKAGRPRIWIYDVKSGKVLTVIRFFLSQDKASSYFEKGELLQELTLITRAPRVPQANPSTTQPAKAAPAPAPIQPEPQVAPQAGMPSGMTDAPVYNPSIAPERSEEKPDELDTIKRNAGITVE